MEPKIGIDVGGVIIDRVNDGTDTSFFSDNYLATTAIPGAFPGIAQLVRHFGAAQVFIVSTAGQTVADKTRHWLNHHDFYARTEMLPENVHFCRTRRDKLPRCQQLGITDMIDDRLEVLRYLVGQVPNLVLFQGHDHDAATADCPPYIHRVQSWAEAANHLIFLPRTWRCVP